MISRSNETAARVNSRATQFDCSERGERKKINPIVIGSLQASRSLVGTLPNGYERNIVTSLLLTFDRSSAEARTLLHIAAAFSPALIPIRTLVRALSAAEQLDWSESQREVETGLAELQTASVLKVRASKNVEIHPLVQAIVRLARSRPEKLRNIEEQIEEILIRDLSCAPEPSRREDMDELLPHAEYLRSHDLKNKAILDAYLGQLYAQLRDTDAALESLRNAYHHTITSNDSEQFRRFVSRAYAEQLIRSGRSVEAEPIYAKLLNADRRAKGEGHPATLSLVTGYIRVLAANQEYDEAARWALETINRYSKVANLATRIRVAGMRSALADVLLARGQLADAFVQLRSATEELSEITFEGSLERCRVGLRYAQTLLTMGRIRSSQGMPGAFIFREFYRFSTLSSWP